MPPCNPAAQVPCLPAASLLTGMTPTRSPVGFIEAVLWRGTDGCFQGGRPVQIIDPNRVRKLLGVWRGPWIINTNISA